MNTMRSKEFTSFDVAAVVRELNDLIIHSRVNNVYQLDSKTILLKLHKTDQPALYLIMEAGKRLHLTSYTQEKPSTPPPFCMALRKYLRNSQLTGVEQHEFERVVVFIFKSNEGALRLTLELFGDGNIILINENEIILQALVYKRMRDRSILRGEKFQFAPSSGKNPMKVSKEELGEALKKFGQVEVVRAIARSLSIGGIYAEESLIEAGLDKATHCDSLSEDNIDAISNGIHDLLRRVTEMELEPSIVMDDHGNLVDVIPFKLKRYEQIGFSFRHCPNLNQALDEFYTRHAATEKATASLHVAELKREEDRLKRIIEDQRETLTHAETEAGKNKHVGDLIYAHSIELQTLLAKFAASNQKESSWKSIAGEILSAKKQGSPTHEFFESLDPKNQTLNVSLENVAFSLSLRKTLFENAGEYYERAKKAKQKAVGAKTALDETQKRLTELETKIRKAETLEQATPAEAIEKLAQRKVKRKAWFEKFRWFCSSDGFLVVAGKDAVSNEVLIKKHTEKEDLVFHADIAGAPFVVIKTEGKKTSEQTLREASEFAAAFSRAWREGFSTVDVYSVKPEQLSKTAPSGEYVTRGAFVVSGQRNWIRNVPLRIAVGLAVNANGEPDFIYGPISAVEKKATTFTAITPGAIGGKELFKHVLFALGETLPQEIREKVLKSSIENIREFIPYGTGTITGKAPIVE